MNIRKRMLKVANNLMEDVIKSFEMTEEEWKKYSELHPNAKRENHTIIPDGTDAIGIPKEDRIKMRNNHRKREFQERKKQHEHIENDTFDMDYLRKHEPEELMFNTLFKEPRENLVKLYRNSLSKNPQTSPETLDLIVRKDKETMENVSQNQSTSRKTLDFIVDNGDYNSRFYVSVHPNTSKDTLKKLSDEKTEKSIRDNAIKRLKGEKIPLLFDDDDEEFYNYHFPSNNNSTDDDWLFK